MAGVFPRSPAAANEVHRSLFRRYVRHALPHAHRNIVSAGVVSSIISVMHKMQEFAERRVIKIERTHPALHARSSGFHSFARALYSPIHLMYGGSECISANGEDLFARYSRSFSAKSIKYNKRQISG